MPSLVRNLPCPAPPQGPAYTPYRSLIAGFYAAAAAAAAARRMAVALAMGRHRRLGSASPIRLLDDLLLALILHSPARPFPGLPPPGLSRSTSGAPRPGGGGS